MENNFDYTLHMSVSPPTTILSTCIYIQIVFEVSSFFFFFFFINIEKVQNF